MKLRVLAILLALSSPAYAQTPRALADEIIAKATALKEMLGPPVVTIPATANIQTALDAVASGSIVQLPAGATLQGPYTIRQSMTIRPDVFMPGVTPLVKILSNASAALIVETGDVTVEGVELTGNAGDLLWIKQTAGHVTLRHVYIHGDPVLGAKRGIQANGHGLTLEDSVITDIFRVGQESAGIGAWDSPGPFTIRRSLVQAAGVNFLFGGADPSSEANTPADILIEDSEFSKKLEWQGHGYSSKNLGELKNAKRVIIRRNLFRYSWGEGQTAFGLVLAVRNQENTAPYSIVEDVLIEDNTIKDVGTGVSILGRDSTPGRVSGVMRNVVFRGNVFEGIDRILWAGSQVPRGTVFEILRGPVDLVIENNQVINHANPHSALFFGHGAYPASGLVVRGNSFVEGQYGIIGDGTLNAPFGVPALNAYAPGTIWENNTVQRSYIRTIPWPTGTTLLP